MLRSIYYSLSPKNRRLVRRLVFLPKDIVESIFGSRHKLVPPKGLSFIGRGNFVKVGDKFFKHISSISKLEKEAKILDIGCGIGRLAKPFTNFLNEKGEYVGFDIINDGIDWCQKKYTQHPQFKFECYPLKNDLYNLSVDKDASKFKFKYEEESFDLCLLISVFTHMQHDELENYIEQISRVLKPSAYCYASFFLYDKGDKYEMFPYQFENYSLHNKKVKNANVAYEKDYISEIAKKNNLIIDSEFSGWWKNGLVKEYEDYQDILVFKKMS